MGPLGGLAQLLELGGWGFVASGGQVVRLSPKKEDEEQKRGLRQLSFKRNISLSLIK